VVPNACEFLGTQNAAGAGVEVVQPLLVLVRRSVHVQHIHHDVYAVERLPESFAGIGVDAGLP
jgi:hypothetical protein